MKISPERILITTAEIDKLYGVSPAVCSRAITAGELQAWKIRGRGKTGQWRMKRADVEAWVFGQDSKELNKEREGGAS